VRRIAALFAFIVLP